MNSPRYRLACFDVDGTLVGKTVFVWQTLHDYFRTDPALRKKAHDDYCAGRISYGQWFEWDIRLLREQGADLSRMQQAISPLELHSGAHEMLAALRQAGLRLAVVSGSLNIVLDKFDLTRHFDQVFLNELFFGRQGQLIGWRPTPFDMENKAAGLEYLTSEYDLDINETVFVGDNFNDLSIARRAGLAIAFNSSCDELIECCHVRIESTDLRDLLPHILGTNPS